jgi:hypothetical protein
MARSTTQPTTAAAARRQSLPGNRPFSRQTSWRPVTPRRAPSAATSQAHTQPVCWSRDSSPCHSRTFKFADMLYYSGTVQSPTHVGYPTFQSSSIPTHSSNRSRMRAASASGLPLNLDLQTRFRSGSGMQPTAHSPGPRPNGTTGLAVSTSYGTTSYSTAPLTSPIDYSRYRSSGPDYSSISQMSAPIAPPNDFSHAFQSMSGSSSRTPIRDSYGSSALGLGHGQSSTDRQDDYSHDALGMHRKRSFHGTSSASATTSQPYGNAA